MFRDAVKSAQKVLAAVAGYRGAIDGKAGPSTLAAALRVPGPAPRGVGSDRLAVAGAQRALADLGFDPGPVDGFFGPTTAAAFAAWAGEALPDRRNESPFGRESDLMLAYGSPGGPDCTAGRVSVPWRMVLAWDPDQVVRSIACHSLVEDSAQRVFDAVAQIYTAREIRDLGLHKFGGCFNLRRKRGGSDWSTHAWGIAFDFDPERNALHMRRDRARLAQEDARPFWEAWEAEQWVSLGRARNYDWMHVQAVRL